MFEVVCFRLTLVLTAAFAIAAVSMSGINWYRAEESRAAMTRAFDEYNHSIDACGND